MSCSEENSNDQIINNIENDTSTINLLPESIKENVELIFVDSFLMEKVKIIDSLTNYRTVLYTIVQKDTLFYITSKDWEGKLDKSIPDKWGIMNTKMEIILPVEYDLISNPGIIKKDLIEVHKNDKYGLIDSKGEIVIDVKYDYLLPIIDNKFSVIGKIKDDFFLVSNLESEILKNFELNKGYFDLDISKINYSELVNATAPNYIDDTQDGNRVYIPSSFFIYFNLLPKVNLNFAITLNEELAFGKIETKISVDNGFDFYEKIEAIVTSFYEKGVDGRGWVKNSKKITLITNNGDFKSNLLLFDEIKEYFGCEGEIYKYKKDVRISKIDSNKIEVFTIGDSNTLYSDCFKCDKYEYYRLNKDGELEIIKSNRKFSFTKHVKIDDSYFRGVFLLRNYNKNEYIHVHKFKNHLSKNELDIMRNEIYAEYGFRFKSTKWREYFSGFNWYKPRFDNVDELLNKTDKYNIDIIIKEYNKLDIYISELEDIDCGYAG